MADVSWSIGTTTALTCTSLASLGSSSTTGARTTAFDNTAGSTGWEDFDIEIVLTSGASGVSATGYASVYLYQASDGTNYETGAATDSGSIACADLPCLGTMFVNANGTLFRRTFQLSKLLPGSMPQKFGFVIVNTSGTALAASGHSVKYTAKRRSIA